MAGIYRPGTSCTRLAGSCSPCRSICRVSRSRVDRCRSSRASRDPAGSSGAAHFSVSSTGSLVFVPGPVSTSSAVVRPRAGRSQRAVQPLKLPPGAYQHPRLSPDGKRIAVGTDDGKDAIVWIYDAVRASSMRRLTFGKAAIVCPSGLRTASASRFSRTAKATSASSGSALTAPGRRSG